MNDGFVLYVVSIPEKSQMSEDIGILMVSVVNRTVQKEEAVRKIKKLFGVTSLEVFRGKIEITGPTTCIKQHVDNFYLPVLNDMVRGWNWDVHPFCALIGSRDRADGKIEYKY